MTILLQTRLATPADIDAMSAIRLSVTENVLRDPSRITRPMYIDYLDKLGRSWVCEVDGVIAGFAAADKVDGSVWALFVDPAWEGHGIGGRLLALVEEYLFAQGHAVLRLSTTAGTRADAFYTAQGWTRAARPDGVDVTFQRTTKRLGFR